MTYFEAFDVFYWLRRLGCWRAALCLIQVQLFLSLFMTIFYIPAKLSLSKFYVIWTTRFLHHFYVCHVLEWLFSLFYKIVRAKCFPITGVFGLPILVGLFLVVISLCTFVLSIQCYLLYWFITLFATQSSTLFSRWVSINLNVKRM